MEDEFVKVHIDLPNHWAIGGESMWAKPLGDNLYQIENVPFYAYGLNYKDIVLATPDSEGVIPEIRKLIEPSGHRTFRLFFEKHVNKGEQEEILNSMKNLKISAERCNSIYIALDLKSDGNYHAVYDKLEELLKKNIIGFETCEARVKDSFDDVPEN